MDGKEDGSDALQDHSTVVGRGNSEKTTSKTSNHQQVTATTTEQPRQGRKDSNVMQCSVGFLILE
jgi:hypothetical protein